MTPVDIEILFALSLLFWAFRLDVLLNLVGKYLYLRLLLAYLDMRAKGAND